MSLKKQNNNTPNETVINFLKKNYLTSKKNKFWYINKRRLGMWQNTSNQANSRRL